MEPLKRILGSEVPIKHVYLRGIGITEKYPAELSHGLESDRVLMSLDLSYNKISKGRWYSCSKHETKRKHCAILFQRLWCVG